MNFKSLVLGAAAAASVLVGNAPAQAAPAECAWLQGNSVDVFPCDRHIRTNANGHVVNDIVWFVGNERFAWSIIVWSDDGVPHYSELFYRGQRIVGSAYRAKDGSLCVTNNNTTFCFL